MKKILPVILLAGSLISARANVFVYSAYLDGPSESPPNGSTGLGYVTVGYDDVLHTLQLTGNFFGLSGTTTASHIHAATTVPLSGTAGVATVQPAFPTFPLGVTAGSFNGTLNLLLLSSYNGAYVTANGGTAATAEAALAAALAGGRSYFNIHTTAVGSGEIRGFLVPEPSSLALLGLSAIGMTVRAWNKKRAIKA